MKTQMKQMFELSWMCTNSSHTALGVNNLLEVKQNVLPWLPEAERDKSLINDCEQSLIQMDHFKWHHLHLI